MSVNEIFHQVTASPPKGRISVIVAAMKQMASNGLGWFPGSRTWAIALALAVMTAAHGQTAPSHEVVAAGRRSHP